VYAAGGTFIDCGSSLANRGQTDIAFNLFKFDARRPKQPLKKYTFKLFDEAMIASMVRFSPCWILITEPVKALFAPHVMRFDLRLPAKQLWSPKGSQESALELGCSTAVRPFSETKLR
jgi:hypothetical protein